MKLADKNNAALLTLALIASSLVALTTTSHAATPAANIMICTDLTTHLPEILRANKKSCDSEDAATIFHPEVIDSPAHSGAGFITLRICTSLNSLFSYQLIRTSCAKYQKTTDYYRAISAPKSPTISSSLAYTHDGAILSISQDADLTDSPITYYLIKNLTTGITTKVARAPLANLTQIHIWNLSAQTQYTFTITAVSADGISATSSVSGAITTPHAPAAPVSTPAFTLSASSESRAANSAATGFSINSTGGAIASFAISPAAPAGMSFSTTTGAFTGTPTTVAAATVYTVTGTNATGSAAQTFTFTVSSGLAAPAFTLSSSSESAGTGSAMTGYTISSTGGAIASYAISPAISTTPGLSFSTATGQISGTPTTVAAAQAYTITATNASGSAVQTFTLTIVYGFGSTGPGGGTIFYYLAVGFNCGNGFTSTGSPSGGLCHYLEVAPNNWSGGADAIKNWADPTNQNCVVPGITDDLTVNNTSAAIGLGRKNSLAIDNQACAGFGNDSSAQAAYFADSYLTGSLQDWYLPTTTELNQLCKYASHQAWTSDATRCTGSGSLLLGLASSTYWSSSGGTASTAYVQNFTNGWQGGQVKDQLYYVRPIRAF